MRLRFAEHIRPATEIRNTIVHAELNWLGKANVDLLMMSMAHNNGMSVYDPKSRCEVTVQGRLGIAAKQYIDSLMPLAQGVGRFTETFLTGLLAVCRDRGLL